MKKKWHRKCKTENPQSF